jgi:hypothetical protein
VALQYGNYASVDDEISYYLKRAREERAAARAAAEVCSREAHFMLAERFADRAHELAEETTGAVIPSGLWERRAAQ